MCEVQGKLTITYDDGFYLKGKIGHQGYYVPNKGGDRMRKQVLECEGEVVNATTVKGMLVRIGGGYATNTIKPVTGYQSIPGNNPVNNSGKPNSRSRPRNNQTDRNGNKNYLWNTGGEMKAIQINRGKPIVCARCGLAGGTLVKVDDKHVHQDETKCRILRLRKGGVRWLSGKLS